MIPVHSHDTGKYWSKTPDCSASAYEQTAAARELFDRNNLFEPEAYRALFAEVEKPDDIKAAEATERPESES